MGVTTILELAEGLSISDRIALAEGILASIRRQLENKTTLDLSAAADLLLKDYQSDTDLTAFTALDSDAFYEAK